jgi:hypothetical protein
VAGGGRRRFAPSGNHPRGPRPSPTGAAYHCPQAAEKIVKAVLVAQGTDFPRTHDIAALVGLISASHPLKMECQDLAQLTLYAVAYRYPAEDEWDVPMTDEIDRWRLRLEDLLERLTRPGRPER